MDFTAYGTESILLIHNGYCHTK